MASKKSDDKKATPIPPVVCDALKSSIVPIETLHIDLRNARKHSERNLEAIAASLKRFGQQKPIVVNKGKVVLAGNGTLSAAISIGWTGIAAVTFKGSKEEERAFALADNRTSELAAWDWEQLTSDLIELQGEGWDLGQLGWEEYELEPLLDTNYKKDEPKGLQPEQLAPKARSITVTEDQRKRIEPATVKFSASSGQAKLTEGEAIARICEDWARR